MTVDRRAEFRDSINAALDRSKIRIVAQEVYVDALAQALAGSYWHGGINRFIPIERADISKTQHGNLLTVTTFSGEGYKSQDACVIVTLEGGDE